METQWFLPKTSEKIVWKKRKRVPQWWIDMMNGKPIKVRLRLKDWRFRYGRTEEGVKETKEEMGKSD